MQCWLPCNDCDDISPFYSFLRFLNEGHETTCQSWDFTSSNHIWLVVLTILKNMKVNGKDYPIY